MAKVKIKNVEKQKFADMKSLLAEITAGKQTLFVTDKNELAENLKMENVFPVVKTSLDYSSIIKLKIEFDKKVDMVIIHSGRLIDRYLNETLNIKRIKSNDYFLGWKDTTEVFILSPFEGTDAMMSHNNDINGKSYKRAQTIMYGPKANTLVNK